MTTTCIRRCVHGGRHLASCADCFCSCHASTPAERIPCDIGAREGGCLARHNRAGCHGCEPRDADRGLVCGRCHVRLGDVFGAREGPEGPHGLAWVYDWLGEYLGSSRPFDTVRTATGYPIAMRVDVHDLRVDILAKLTDWTAAVCGELGRAGPARMTVSGITGWMLAQLPGVESHHMVGPLIAELLEGDDGLLTAAHTLVPWRPARRRLLGVPCPFCHDQTSLTIIGGEVDITCTTCHETLEASAYHRWTEHLVRLHQQARAS